MKVSLWTPTPAFSNDLADVMRVFWGGIELRVNEDGGDVTVIHREALRDGACRCRMEMTGAFSGASERL